jgi:branched-chain amino acid transport system permease protein
MTMASPASILRQKQRSPLRRAIEIGLIFGVIAVYLAIVGLLLMFHGRWIIVDTLSLGHAALITIGIGAGITVARGAALEVTGEVLVQSLIAGAIAGGLLGVLVIAMEAIDLRSMFISLPVALSEMLTFDLGLPLGLAILVVGGAALAGLGAVLAHSPPIVRKPLIVGCAAVAFFGVFQELLQLMMQFNSLIDAVRDTLFTWEGMTLQGAIIVFVVAAGGSALWTRYRDRLVTAHFTPAQHRQMAIGRMVLGIVLVLLFPLLAGSYIGQVMMLVGLYTLMGMGLNLEVGLAGLLDLGFVAFFAVGAYATALLTADSPHALASLTYWQAMPIAVLCSIIVGVLFGIPVLGVRGDYLAVATMGLGEIVRVIVQSDAAAPLLAGAQGILQIPKPSIFGHELSDPVALFYVTFVASAVAAYFAWRLENSALGRAWMAVRDDEDVAQALGINLVKVKLLAYGLGAAFAGLAGSIFATMLTSIYPSSFQLLISINVLALIIVGGMGSLPGVVVGAAALVGLPELLREFGEYRYLFYGAVLIIMMRIKPEGLWPSATRRRELRDEAGEPEAPEDLQQDLQQIEGSGALAASVASAATPGPGRS